MRFLSLWIHALFAVSDTTLRAEAAKISATEKELRASGDLSGLRKLQHRKVKNQEELAGLKVSSDFFSQMFPLEKQEGVRNRKGFLRRIFDLFSQERGKVVYHEF